MRLELPAAREYEIRLKVKKDEKARASVPQCLTFKGMRRTLPSQLLSTLNSPLVTGHWSLVTSGSPRSKSWPASRLLRKLLLRRLTPVRLRLFHFDQLERPEKLRQVDHFVRSRS